MRNYQPNDIEFPSYQATLEIISKLNQCQWKEFTSGMDVTSYVEETTRIITNICQYLPGFCLVAPPQSSWTFNIFRVRKWSEIDDITAMNRYSYPPKEKTNFNLRANLIGNPVFYGSEHPLFALWEYIHQWDSADEFQADDYVISKWIIKRDKSFLFVPYLSENLQSQNVYSILSQTTDEQIRNVFNANLSHDQIKGIRELKNYFSELFINDKYRLISSVLGYWHTYKLPEKPVLIYPSIKAHQKRVNFAIHPDFVENKIHLSHIYKLKVNSIEEVDSLKVNSNHSYEKIGFNINSKIEWYPIREHKDLVNKLFREDFEQEKNLIS